MYTPDEDLDIIPDPLQAKIPIDKGKISEVYYISDRFYQTVIQTSSKTDARTKKSHSQGSYI